MVLRPSPRRRAQITDEKLVKVSLVFSSSERYRAILCDRDARRACPVFKFGSGADASPVTAEKYQWLSHRAYVQRGSSLHSSRSIRRFIRAARVGHWAILLFLRLSDRAVSRLYTDGRRQKRIGQSPIPRRRRYVTHRHYAARTAQAVTRRKRSLPQ